MSENNSSNYAIIIDTFRQFNYPFADAEIRFIDEKAEKETIQQNITTKLQTLVAKYVFCKKFTNTTDFTNYFQSHDLLIGTSTNLYGNQAGYDNFNGLLMKKAYLPVHKNAYNRDYEFAIIASLPQGKFYFINWDKLKTLPYETSRYSHFFEMDYFEDFELVYNFIKN